MKVRGICLWTILEIKVRHPLYERCADKLKRTKHNTDGLLIGYQYELALVNFSHVAEGKRCRLEHYSKLKFIMLLYLCFRNKIAILDLGIGRGFFQH